MNYIRIAIIDRINRVSVVVAIARRAKDSRPVRLLIETIGKRISNDGAVNCDFSRFPKSARAYHPKAYRLRITNRISIILLKRFETIRVRDR